MIVSKRRFTARKRNNQMRKILYAVLLGGQILAAQVSLGIEIGPPPPVRHYARPVSPGADYLWVDGYWYADGHRWKWHNGYWSRPPYAGAHWIAPRYEQRRFYNGYWEGGGKHVEHNHDWDRNHRDRDYHHEH